jgi:hypothetical protein
MVADTKDRLRSIESEAATISTELISAQTQLYDMRSALFARVIGE